LVKDQASTTTLFGWIDTYNVQVFHGWFQVFCDFNRWFFL